MPCHVISRSMILYRIASYRTVSIYQVHRIHFVCTCPFGHAQRSSMESLQARMRRRMAGLARHRQLDGNPAHWRARGRGPFPLHMPYPPAYPAHNSPRRMRAAGRAAAVLPVPRPGSGGPGEWQPFVGLGADWVPPFVPRMSPPFPPKDGAGGAGACLLYTSPSPRDKRQSRMPSSA